MGVRLRFDERRGWSVRVTFRGKRTEHTRDLQGTRFGPEGEERARAFAEELKEAHKAELRRANARPGMPQPIDQLVRDWRVTEAEFRSERTQATDVARVNRLADFFGSKDARRLTEADCKRFASSVRREGRSASIVRGCLSTLRVVLNRAVLDGVLDRNPVPGIWRVIRAVEAQAADEVPRPNAWTHEEADTLLALAARYEPAFYGPLLFAFHTGARRGEILALRWEDVDFERARVRIGRTVRLGSRGTRVPKGRRDRFSPLSDQCFEMLRAQRRPTRLVTEVQRRTVQRSTQWTFPSPHGGGLWAESSFKLVWERVRERARQQGVRPLTFHSTRHTFVTWGLEAGTPAKHVSEWVGASVSVLERHYAHVMPQTSVDLSFLGRGGTGATRSRR